MIKFDISNLLERWRIVVRRLFRRLPPLYTFKLYMVRPGSDPDDCGDDEVVEVSRGAYTLAESSNIEHIYNELLSLREREYNEELINALWRSRLTLERAYVDGADVAHIELTGDLVADEPCAASRISAQLKRPALQVRSGGGTVTSTEVQVNGRPLEDALS